MRLRGKHLTHWIGISVMTAALFGAPAAFAGGEAVGRAPERTIARLDHLMARLFTPTTRWLLGHGARGERMLESAQRKRIVRIVKAMDKKRDGWPAEFGKRPTLLTPVLTYQGQHGMKEGLFLVSTTGPFAWLFGDRGNFVTCTLYPTLNPGPEGASDRFDDYAFLRGITVGSGRYGYSKEMSKGIESEINKGISLETLGAALITLSAKAKAGTLDVFAVKPHTNAD